MYVKTHTGLGLAKGEQIAMTFTHGGKTNISGHRQFTGNIHNDLLTDFWLLGYLPHKNPLLCTNFAKGMMLLWRWEFMGEEFGHLSDLKSWYNTRVLRTGAGHDVEASYDSSYIRFKTLYRSLKIWCNKVLHQGRVTGQMEMDDAGVDDPQALRFCGYAHTDRDESYLLNFPLEPLLERAGTLTSKYAS